MDCGTFKRGKNIDSQIDIFLVYNLPHQKFEIFDGHIYINNHGHSILRAVVSLNLTAKNNIKYIESKFKPSDSVLNAASVRRIMIFYKVLIWNMPETFLMSFNMKFSGIF